MKFRLVVLVSVVLPALALGQVNSWTNNNFGKWEVGSNWSLGVPPTNTQSAFITNFFSKTVTVDATTVASNAINSCLTINNLMVSGPLSPLSANTLSLNNAGLATNLHIQNSLTIGDRGAVGIFNSVLRVSGVISNDGIMSLNTGVILATNSPMIVGNARLGQLTVFDGTMRANSVIVGRLGGSQGTLTISGGTNSYSIDLGLEANATGTVWVTGGELTASNGSIQVGSAGVGQMTVSNGTVTADSIGVTLFPGSVGTLTVAGGSVAIDRLVATNSGATVEFPAGTMTLRGAEVDNAQTFVIGGAGQTAALNIVAGTNRFAAGLIAGLPANSIGTVWVTGGELLTTNFTTTIASLGIGTLILSNGTWRAERVLIGDSGVAFGTLRVAGGTCTLTGSLRLGGDSATATGAVWLTAGQLFVTNAPTIIGGAGRGQMTVSNGTWRAREAIVGNLMGSEGTLTIAGGTNAVASMLNVGLSSGATGTVWVKDGQLIVTNAAAFPATFIASNGVGRVTVSNGLFRTAKMFIGWEPGSRGTLAISGGTIDVTEYFNLGALSNSLGTLLINGGELVSTNNFTGIGASFGDGIAIVSNGTWRAQGISLGSNLGSHGTLVVAGGTCLLSGLLGLGFDTPLSTGIVVVTGGQLLVTNDTTYVGVNGVGDMTVSNGTWQAQEVRVGSFPGSRGELRITGGTNVFSASFLIGTDAGATGTVSLTGGQLAVTNAITFVGSSGVGQMTVSNGTWQAVRLTVGNGTGSQGTLRIAGGTTIVSDSIDLGNQPGATGTVLMTGGELSALDDYTAVGFEGVGQMTVAGGLWQTREMDVGVFPGARGTLMLTGGTNRASTSMFLGDFDCTATGIVVVAGGNLIVTNAGATAELEVRTGTLTLNSGTVRVDRIVITNACAQFVRTGGTLIYGSAVLNPSADTDGDGFSNQNELDAGNDPLDPTNFPGSTKIFPPGDVNGTNGVTTADSLLINQVLVNLRSSNDVIFATAGFANGDVNQDGQVNGGDSLLINQEAVDLRSYIVTKIVPNVRSNNVPTPVTIFGIGFPTNTVSGATIGPPVNLDLSNVTVISREQITAIVPAGGGIGTGTVNVAATPTNGVISFGRFINQ